MWGRNRLPAPTEAFADNTLAGGGRGGAFLRPQGLLLPPTLASDDAPASHRTLVCAGPGSCLEVLEMKLRAVRNKGPLPVLAAEPKSTNTQDVPRASFCHTNAAQAGCRESPGPGTARMCMPAKSRRNPGAGSAGLGPLPGCFRRAFRETSPSPPTPILPQTASDVVTCSQENSYKPPCPKTICT